MKLFDKPSVLIFIIIASACGLFGFATCDGTVLIAAAFFYFIALQIERHNERV